MMNIVYVIAGLSMLAYAGDGIVKGASSLATRLKISTLVIGLTVVAFGTSAPELVVSLIAAFGGSPDVAVGNLIGSNIANILLVLGLSALIAVLPVQNSTIWREIPFALLGVLLLLIMGNTNVFGLGESAVSRLEGGLLLVFMLAFLVYIYRSIKKHRADASEIVDVGEQIKDYSLSKASAITLVSLAGLFVGGRLLVSGAVGIASALGLSEALIGLTVVAVGTSLPELATSVAAARNKHVDIAIGNIVGSNIFNIMFVLGTVSVISPISYNPAMNTDVLVAVAATVMLFVFLFLGKKHRLTKHEGAAFLLSYLAYTVYLVIRG